MGSNTYLRQKKMVCVYLIFMSNVMYEKLYDAPERKKTSFGSNKG